MDKADAALLMRYMSAMDLMLGGVLHVLEQKPELDPDGKMVEGVYGAINLLHLAVRRPLVRNHPDLDYDDR